MREFKKARGTPDEDATKARFREAMLKARSNSCEGVIKVIEKTVGDSADIDAKTAKQVKHFIRPKRSAAKLMKVDGEIVGESTVLKMWPAYFQAQSSLKGPLSPSQVLECVRGSQPTATIETIHATGEVVTADDTPPRSVADPHAEDLEMARQGYEDEAEAFPQPEEMEEIADADREIYSHRADTESAGNNRKDVQPSAAEFDEEALEGFHEFERQHSATAKRAVSDAGRKRVFGWGEFCDAIERANIEANTSPLDPIPLGAVTVEAK